MNEKFLYSLGIVLGIVLEHFPNRETILSVLKSASPCGKFSLWNILQWPYHTLHVLVKPQSLFIFSSCVKLGCCIL